MVEQLFSDKISLDISALATGSYVAIVYCGKRIGNLRFGKYKRIIKLHNTTNFRRALHS